MSIQEKHLYLTEDSLTKTQKKFIGSQFITPKGGVLTVIGVINEVKPKFGLTCSICSKDEELWPEGSIKMSKSCLIRGRSGCGCSDRVVWTTEQYEIKIKRICKEKGYVFHGFYGKWRNNKTKLILECLNDGNKWKTTSIIKLITGKGCKSCAVKCVGESNKVDDSWFINEFYSSGKFKDGTVFCRNTSRTCSKGSFKYWDYKCPKCSYDEYVISGNCNGVFTATAAQLKVGMLSCRCTKMCSLSQKQKEYDVNKICEIEGLKFSGWIDSGNRKDSVLKWVCVNGHKCKTRFDCFIRGHRCSVCSKSNFNGYMPERSKEKDFLYVIQFSKEYIKVGRTFNLKERLSQLRSSSGIKDLVVLNIYTSDHETVYETEQCLHYELEELGYYHNDSDWSTETFKLESLDILYKLIQNYNICVI